MPQYSLVFPGAVILDELGVVVEWEVIQDSIVAYWQCAERLVVLAWRLRNERNRVLGILSARGDQSVEYSA